MPLIADTHLPGRHCASSGIRDLVEFHGIKLTEAMCFGIGAGLGIWRFPTPNPSRLVHVRSQDLEEQFFRRIGLDFSWSQFADGPDSHRGLLEALDNGLPALLQTDIYYLPYYNSSTHFPGHVIVAWGYDPETQQILVSDTERTELQQVPFEAMQQSRFSETPMFTNRGNMFAPPTLAIDGGMERIVTEAIRFCSERLLEGMPEFGGIPAMEYWLGELDQWNDFEDWQWTARFTYQVIEKRGTGGGGFRLMYADFLDDAAAMLPRVATLGLPEMMREVAGAWTGLADACKAVSEGDEPDFRIIEPALKRVLKYEGAYHRTASLLA